MPPKTTPTRSFPLVGRFSPVSYGSVEEHHCLHSVVWVAPEKFRSLPPLPPSVLPSFLPSVSFRRRRHRRPSITRVKVISQLVLAQRPWSHIRYIPAQRSAVLSLGHTGLRSRVRLLAGSQAKTGKGRQAGK